MLHGGSWNNQPMNWIKIYCEKYCIWNGATTEKNKWLVSYCTRRQHTMAISIQSNVIKNYQIDCHLNANTQRTDAINAFNANGKIIDKLFANNIQGKMRKWLK